MYSLEEETLLMDPFHGKLFSQDWVAEVRGRRSANGGLLEMMGKLNETMLILSGRLVSVCSRIERGEYYELNITFPFKIVLFRAVVSPPNLLCLAGC